MQHAQHAHHVLLVDDEEAILYVFRKYLERAGFAVSTAAGAMEAIAIFDAGHVDVLVTDQRMPGMQGDALVQHLRAARPNLPAIIVTAYAAECSPDLRNVPVLNKPVPPADLVTAVQRALAA
ncbi:response regulator [uncultured Massilia sp.]|uniref:response regulator n=1 Tax=uncultured Massilia sp. TaxID=169973 RepID=UPI002582DD37|nr:response regulator [uncultured Massilia sp.]